MSQHDYVIANGTGAAVRSDLNNALAAIVSQNSGATEPATMYAYQWWADTTTGMLKLRNAANNAWITLRELDGTLTIEDGTAGSPGLAFADDLNTGIYSPGADQVAISTNGTERARIDSSGRVLVGTTTANTSGAKLQTLDGITFPATQVASADPNTLDDYEEGTWTPTWGTQINAPNGATGLTVVNANYTKIGTLVHVRATIALVGASGTFAANTTIIIAGLPFTTVNRSGSTAFSSGGGDYATWVGQVDTSAIRIAAATINGTASTNNIHVAATYVST
jgi:hypothetical protein